MPKFFFSSSQTLGLELNMDVRPGSRSRMNKIPAIVLRRNIRQLTPRPLINLLLPNFRGMFGELRLFMPYPEKKARFENICFKEKIILRGKLNNLCERPKNNNRCKIVSRTLSRLNISHVDRSPALPRR